MSARPAGDPTLRWNERAYGSWDEMPMGDGRHRRLAIVYLAATAVCLLGGALFHPFFLALALLFAALGAVEYAMWRRSRPTSRIPDYRQPEPAEIDLEQP
ncbi:hypothetical protein BDK89_0369 [Ilumatobacter fluminis]|uniref:Uncharacterized protein n=1 Tax=Ilumatobacter fluminis TaxID=467091 RepID=A0A4R7HV48_9ACTN|nr:hypothetical protein [Ilumatobacter fluminis]TDT14812.1 hypothetical protein BDK89_0369 [Ilumatobacter fluminis]